MGSSEKRRESGERMVVGEIKRPKKIKCSAHSPALQCTEGDGGTLKSR